MTAPTLDAQGRPPLGYELRERDGIRKLTRCLPGHGPFSSSYDPDEWHYATPEDEAKTVAKHGPPPVLSPLLRRVAYVSAFAARGGRKNEGDAA